MYENIQDSNYAFEDNVYDKLGDGSRSRSQ